MEITFSGIETTANLLNILLSFFGSIAMVLVIAILWNFVGVSRDLRSVMRKMADFTETAEGLLMLPLQLLAEIAKKAHESLSHRKK